MKDSDQAKHALEFLEICHDIETGGFNGSDLTARDLDATEVQVKAKALRALSIYFGSTPARDEPASETKPKGKKSTKAPKTP